MIMKMNKLVTTSLLGVSLLTTAYAGVVPNMESYKAEITNIRRTETPGKVLSLVQSADQEIRLDLSVALLKVVADRSHSLLPSTVSSLSSKFPAFAAELAAEASKLAPEYATSIAQAASVSAPDQSHLIAAAVAKQNPSKAVRIARTVSEVLPSHELQISYYVSKVEPQVSRGLSAEMQTALSYLGQNVTLGSDYFSALAVVNQYIDQQGFVSQQTVAQAEAAQIIFDILDKVTDPVAKERVRANLTAAFAPGSKVKLDDIRSFAQGNEVTFGTTTISLTSAFNGTGAGTPTPFTSTQIVDSRNTATNLVKAKLVVFIKAAAAKSDRAALVILTGSETAADRILANNTENFIDTDQATQNTIAGKVFITGGAGTQATGVLIKNVVVDNYGAL